VVKYKPIYEKISQSEGIFVNHKEILMSLELTSLTPYFLFFFGVVITYIGWSTKKILENIESAIKDTSEKVDHHDRHIAEILTVLKVHDFQINLLNSEVVELKKSGKIVKKE
jgi:hypothetical protein